MFLCKSRNGDTAYISTYDANLDFFGLAAASRYNQEQVSKLFLSAYSEDPSLALMNLLYLRDIRSGLGERDSFRTCFDILCRFSLQHTVTSSTFLDTKMCFTSTF